MVFGAPKGVHSYVRLIVVVEVDFYKYVLIGSIFIKKESVTAV